MDDRDVTEAYLAERGKPWTQDQIAGDDMELKLNTPLQIPFHAPKGPDGEHPALTWINKHSPNGGNGANRGMFKMLRVYVVDKDKKRPKQEGSGATTTSRKPSLKHATLYFACCCAGEYRPRANTATTTATSNSTNDPAVSSSSSWTIT